MQGLVDIGMHLMEELALQADCDSSADLVATLDIPAPADLAYPLPDLSS